MKMAPSIESDVIGRHGQFGVDVLTHDLPLEAGTPVEINYVELVDEMDRRIAENLRRERAQALAERGGAMAVADMVNVETAQDSPAEPEKFGLYL